jgi:hypothetical protein
VYMPGKVCETDDNSSDPFALAGETCSTKEKANPELRATPPPAETVAKGSGKEGDTTVIVPPACGKHEVSEDNTIPNDAGIDTVSIPGAGLRVDGVKVNECTGALVRSFLSLIAALPVVSRLRGHQDSAA